MSEFEFVKLEARSEEERRRARAALAARFKGERLRNARRVVATLAAAVGLPLWVQAGWPGLLARRTVAIGFALFAVLGVALVGIAVREYTWYRRGERARQRRDRPA